ncbi:MAG: ABC transporter permease [Candidatus Omnitrophica bacterium]|nr:ABC transporter permease [Candidatus Omnitrophota bacterium]
MTSYLFSRLLGLIPVLLWITVISFGIMHLAPGKPTDAALQFNPKVSLEARQRMEKLYGLDQPLPAQYLQWLGRLSRLDFGRSFLDDRPVMEKIVERLPITLTINVWSLLLILGLAVPLGVISAVRPGGLFDRLTTVFVFIGYSMPSFWLALLCMALFGVTLRWLPVSGVHSLDHESFGLIQRWLDTAWHLLLPISIAAFVSLAGMSRYMRSSMVEVLRQDYIRTARAKGLPERRVLFRHGLRNALLPVITILGLSLPDLIGGSVIAETIFSIPGMGRLFYEAVMARDYPVVMALVTVGAVLTMLGNLLADLGYAYADPRIRVGKGER